MSVHIIFRHGLESHRTSIIPRLGEPIYTTDENKLYVGDSTTPGGIPVKCDAGSIAGLPIESGTPNDGDILIYNASTNQWEFGTGGGGGGCTNLNCLTDVNTSGASNGQVLSFNGTQWVPASLSSGGCTDLDCLSDVDTSGATNGQVLTFDGTQWTPQDPAGGSLRYARLFLFG